MKKIILAMIAVVIIIVILIISIILINDNNRNDFESVVYDDIEQVTKKSTFYRVDACIKTYYQYVYDNNMKAMQAINAGYNDNKKITNPNFQSREMYLIDKVNNVTVYVYGVIREKNIQDNYYIIVNLDYQNNTFSVINSSKEEFENAVNNTIDEKYKEDIYIEKNEYNEIKEATVTDFSIINTYFEDYKFKALYKPEEAFSIIDEEYRKKKFGNDIEQYKTYIQANLDRFQDANIVKYAVTKEGQFGVYVAMDSFNNYYQITETGINEYTITLDNYTLEDEKITSRYNKASDKDKVISNIDKIMKLINEKSYEVVYQYLNTDFKNNYFTTLESFKSYIEKKFFDNNIVGSVNISLEGQYYVITVPYKESISTAAEEREITIMMQLKEGMDFEIAFRMQ